MIEKRTVILNYLGANNTPQTKELTGTKPGYSFTASADPALGIPATVRIFADENTFVIPESRLVSIELK